MAKFFDEIDEKLKSFILDQKIFFVATAARDGRINLSPKGYDSLRVLGPTRIVWLNLSGSGNETAAHLLSLNRITLMFCSFDSTPLILRVYGSGKAIHPRDEHWPELAQKFRDYPGMRQIIDVKVESVQTSCGFGVPFFDFAGERNKLVEHFDAKGVEATESGWLTKNAISIDGLPTGIESRDPTIVLDKGECAD